MLLFLLLSGLCCAEGWLGYWLNAPVTWWNTFIYHVFRNRLKIDWIKGWVCEGECKTVHLGYFPFSRHFSSRETYASLIAWKVSPKAPGVKCRAQGHINNWTGLWPFPGSLILRTVAAYFTGPDTWRIFLFSILLLIHLCYHMKYFEMSVVSLNCLTVS